MGTDAGVSLLRCVTRSGAAACQGQMDVSRRTTVLSGTLGAQAEWIAGQGTREEIANADSTFSEIPKAARPAQYHVAVGLIRVVHGARGRMDAGRAVGGSAEIREVPVVTIGV